MSNFTHGNPAIKRSGYGRRRIDDHYISLADWGNPLDKDATITHFSFYAIFPCCLTLVMYRQTTSSSNSKLPKFEVVGQSKEVIAETPGVLRTELTNPIECKEGDIIGWYSKSPMAVAYNWIGEKKTHTWAGSGIKRILYNKSRNQKIDNTLDQHADLMCSINVEGCAVGEDSAPAEEEEVQAPAPTPTLFGGWPLVDGSGASGANPVQYSEHFRPNFDSSDNNCYSCFFAPLDMDITITHFGIFAKTAGKVQLVMYRPESPKVRVLGKSQMVMAKLGVNRFQLDVPIRCKKKDNIGWYVPNGQVVAYNKVGSKIAPLFSKDYPLMIWTPPGATANDFKHNATRRYSINIEGVPPGTNFAVVPPTNNVVPPGTNVEVVPPTAEVVPPTAEVVAPTLDGVPSNLQGMGVVVTTLLYDPEVKQNHQSNEYVEITECDGNNVDIAGWKIQCRNRKYTFVFPSGTIIKGGTSYRVYTNEVHHETGGFSFGSKRPIWNNAKKGDKATLYDVSGHVVSVLGFGRWAVEGIEDDGNGVKMIGFDAQPNPEVYP